MRSSVFVVSSFVALALAAGCAVDPFASSPEAKDAGGPNVDGGVGNDGQAPVADAAPVIDAALPPGCDAKKLPADDACVIDEAAAVFVSTTGSASGDGTRAKPLASIADGITLAKLAKKRVYVCEGSYPESVVLANGVSMFGGFDCTSWKWNASGRAKIASPQSPAMRATSINLDTRVEGFDVVAPAGTANAPSSIGFIAATSPGVRFVHGSITAGAGFAGAPGSDAVQLANGPWVDGDANMKDAYCGTSILCQTQHGFKNGGTNTCVGKTGYVGGAGGEGGNGGSFIDNGFQWSQQTATSVGLPQVATSATAAGSTGVSASQVGAAGTVGTNGANGTAGVFSASGFTPADGTAATDGAPGQGGGGGAGYGVPNSRLNAYANGALVYGIPGSGGGAGGCPGLAGSQGKGGGASVALLATDSPMTFEDSKLVASAGGAGGAAGASTAGTSGGAGGADATGYGLALAGKFLGASGGAGGNAGLSGQGAGGPSVGYAYHGVAPTFLSTPITFGAGGSGAPAKVVPAGTIPASPDGLAANSTTF